MSLLYNNQLTVVFVLDGLTFKHFKWSIIMETELEIRGAKVTSISTSCVISWSNPMFGHLLELSWWDNSNKWSNIRFGQETGIIEIKYAPYLEPWWQSQFINVTYPFFIHPVNISIVIQVLIWPVIGQWEVVSEASLTIHQHLDGTAICHLLSSDSAPLCYEQNMYHIRLYTNLYKWNLTFSNTCYILGKKNSH